MLQDSNLYLIPYTQYLTLQGLSCNSVHCASGNTTQPVYVHCSAHRAVLYHVETHYATLWTWTLSNVFLYGRAAGPTIPVLRIKSPLWYHFTITLYGPSGESRTHTCRIKSPLCYHNISKGWIVLYLFIVPSRTIQSLRTTLSVYRVSCLSPLKNVLYNKLKLLSICVGAPRQNRTAVSGLQNRHNAIILEERKPLRGDQRGSNPYYQSHSLGCYHYNMVTPK